MGTKSSFLKYPLSSIIAGFFLVSCGGDDGGATSPPPAQIQTLESDVAVTINPQTVTGQLSGQSIGLRKLQTSAEFRLEVISTDQSGNRIDRKILSITPTKPASIRVKLSDNGGTITVKATAEGYNEATKSIKYATPEEVKNLTLELTPVPVKTRILNVPAITIQSHGKEYIRFAIFKDAQGLTKLVAGENEIKKQENAQKIIDVSIPLNKLQQDTQTLKVEYRDFQPSNPDDYRNFPGEETVGGDKLVSFGFDYLNITDPNGNNPFNQNPQGLKATLLEGEYYRILRYVDCNQINKLKQAGILRDEDPNKEGIQFTFYAFDWDQGGWVEAGQGVFVSRDSIDYMSSTWDQIIQNGCSNDPDSNLPDCSTNGVITDINNICPQDENGGYRLTWVVVSVTNPELAWKNLDYIVPGEGKCCEVTVIDEGGNPVSGTHVYVQPTGNIEWTEGYTDANGQVTLCAIAYGDQDLTGTLYVYDPYNYSYSYTNIDFGNEPCSITVTLTNPNKCTVEGKAVYEGTNNPVSDAYVEVFNPDYTVYRWGYTNASGEYSIKVPCEEPLYVRVNYSPDVLSFNVDGSLSGNEVSDDGNIARLIDYKVQNNPPDGYVYATDYTISADADVTITVCAWDWEGDYPIDYSVNVSQGTVEPSSGEINEDEWCEDITYSAPENVNGLTNVTLNFTFTDEAEKQSSTSLSLTVSPGTFPPVGYLFGTCKEGENNTYIYEVYAYYYDEDSNNSDITLNITNDCGAQETNRNIEQGENWGEIEVEYTSSQDTCTFTLELDDNPSDKDVITESLTLTCGKGVANIIIQGNK